MELFKPLENEGLDEYIYRLVKNKEILNLTWTNICDNVYAYYGKKYSKDFLRHQSYGLKQKDKIDEVGVSTRILSVSDQHYPFNLPVDVLKEYVGKVDILQFNGDDQDGQSISKFQKKYRIPFVDEMIGTRQMIIDAIEFIKPKKVILNYGNHNSRLISYFSDKLHDDMLQLMPETNLDFIIDTGFYKYDHKQKTKTYYEPLTKVYAEKGIEVEYSKSWWCKIGKTIFAHPKAYKSGILGTTEKAYLYFMQIGQRDIDAIVMAHTHQQGITRYGKCFLIEQGSLCQEQEYATSGGMSKPQSNGFVYIVQDKEDNFLYDKSELVFL